MTPALTTGKTSNHHRFYGYAITVKSAAQVEPDTDGRVKAVTSVDHKNIMYAVKYGMMIYSATLHCCVCRYIITWLIFQQRKHRLPKTRRHRMSSSSCSALAWQALTLRMQIVNSACWSSWQTSCSGMGPNNPSRVFRASLIANWPAIIRTLLLNEFHRCQSSCSQSSFNLWFVSIYPSPTPPVATTVWLVQL